MSTPHTHVASGLAGYGPDAADSNGFIVTHNVRETAEAIRDELNAWADVAYEAAEALADSGDYEQAWTEHKRSQALETLRMNLDSKREEAPLYKGKPELWEATLWRLINENFPLDVSHNSRLYVWDCIEDDAETEEEGN
jgi:hypothetical protein